MENVQEHQCAGSDDTTTRAGRQVTFERGDEVELAETLIASFESELTFDDGDFYQYNSNLGIWEKLSKEALQNEVSQYAGCPVLSSRLHPLTLNSRTIDGVLKVARAKLMATPSRYRFSNAVPGVTFANGLASVFQGDIYLDPHEAVSMARHSFPFDFVPGAPHPLLDNFFEQVFADIDPADRKQQIALCQEFVGIALIGEATLYQRCLVLYGPGGNGKSAWLKIVQHIFPPDSVVTVPPQDWGAQFRTASLVGARVNLVNEIPQHDIMANATFKSVISGEPIQGERKYQEPFTFQARAGHIFAANRLPSTSDQSHGFWRRFLVVPFTRDMEKSPEHRRGVARTILRQEHSAIIGWALEGAARVQRQGGYTEPASSRRLVNRWQQEADSVRCFLETECAVEPTALVSAKALYLQYNRWATNNGFLPVSSVAFGRRANGAGFISTHTNSGNYYSLRPASGDSW